MQTNQGSRLSLGRLKITVLSTEKVVEYRIIRCLVRHVCVPAEETPSGRHQANCLEGIPRSTINAQNDGSARSGRNGNVCHFSSQKVLIAALKSSNTAFMAEIG